MYTKFIGSQSVSRRVIAMASSAVANDNDNDNHRILASFQLADLVQ
jgi:hypothetical protein